MSFFKCGIVRLVKFEAQINLEVKTKIYLINFSRKLYFKSFVYMEGVHVMMIFNAIFNI